MNLIFVRRDFLVMFFLSLSLFSNCQFKDQQLKPSLEKDGEIFVYLQPLPQEAAKINFSIEDIRAIKSDETEYPISVLLSEFSDNNTRRQRLISTGWLPPGDYIGLTFRVIKAFLKVEDKKMADLLIQDAPQKIEFNFNVNEKKATLISLLFKYNNSLPDGVTFTPSFSAFIPEKPVTGLTGFVTNYRSNNITVFDKKSGEVKSVIETGRGPMGMVIDRRQMRAYVALSEEDAIDVIDITAGEIITRIKLFPGDAPQELALTPNQRILLSANTGSDTLSIIDPVSFIELARIDAGDSPNSVVIDPSGIRAYVFNTFSDNISVIDIAARAVVAKVNSDPRPLRGEFNAKGNKLYVFHKWAPYFTVIDPFTFTVVKKIFVGSEVSSIKVDTNTDMIYIGSMEDKYIKVYDPFSFIPVYSIYSGAGVDYMTIDGEENNLHLILNQKNSFLIVNLINKKIVHETDAGENPYWVTVMGER